MGRTLPKTHKSIRHAVAWLLKDDRHSGQLFSVDRIADVLNIATNAEHDDGYTTKFDGRTIVEAFANGSSHEYALVYDHMGFEGDTTGLYVRLSRRNDPAERRQSAIGRFESLKQGHAAEVKHLLPDLDILNEPERDGLLQFLQSKSSDDGNGDAVDIEMQLNEANEKIKRLEEELQSAKEQLSYRIDHNKMRQLPIRLLIVLQVETMSKMQWVE